MSEQISNPLLALIKERNLIDDLQLEEVIQEQARTGKSFSQILQDFDLVDLDTQLQVMAEHLGTEVVNLRDVDLPAEVVETIPPDTARMYQCVPVAVQGRTVQVAMVDPLNPAAIDELGYIIGKEIQLVVADPAAVESLISKYYGEETERSATSSRNWVATRRSPRRPARRL